MSAWTQATDGRDFEVGEHAVLVSDGHCTWACTRSAWDRAEADLSARADIDDSEGDAGYLAYDALCGTVSAHSAIASNDAGSAHGSRDEQAAICEALVADGILSHANLADRGLIAGKWAERAEAANEEG